MLQFSFHPPKKPRSQLKKPANSLGDKVKQNNLLSMIPTNSNFSPLKNMLMSSQERCCNSILMHTQKQEPTKKTQLQTAWVTK